MKKAKRIISLVVAFVLLMSGTAFAAGMTWESAPGHHNQSVILDASHLSSEDVFHQYGRGEMLAEGSVKIINNKNGTIGIEIATLAYHNVDRICHTVFLDQWDEDENDWIPVDDWEFERTKEEADNNLHRLSTSFKLTGYEVNKIYRVRGLHLVELGDDIEGCATETNGVLITNH